MNIPINHHVIEHKGKPVAVVAPYAEYVKKFAPEPTIPNDVIGRVIVGNATLIRAWREYRGLTQTETARRMGMSQPAYQQIEDKTGKPRPATLKKLAQALEVEEKQLYL
jgi:DNA-binding XRE family transcriptional regulator